MTAKIHFMRLPETKSSIILNRYKLIVNFDMNFVTGITGLKLPRDELYILYTDTYMCYLNTQSSQKNESLHGTPYNLYDRRPSPPHRLHILVSSTLNLFILSKSLRQYEGLHKTKKQKAVGI